MMKRLLAIAMCACLNKQRSVHPCLRAELRYSHRRRSENSVEHFPEYLDEKRNLAKMIRTLIDWSGDVLCSGHFDLFLN